MKTSSVLRSLISKYNLFVVVSSITVLLTALAIETFVLDMVRLIFCGRKWRSFFMVIGIVLNEILSTFRTLSEDLCSDDAIFLLSLIEENVER
jgi:hypothetical protein